MSALVTGFLFAAKVMLAVKPGLPVNLLQWQPMIHAADSGVGSGVLSAERVLWLFHDEGDANPGAKLLPLVALSSDHFTVAVLTPKGLESPIGRLLTPHLYITRSQSMWPGSGYAYYENGLLCAQGQDLPSFERAVYWSGIMERSGAVFKEVGEPLDFEGFIFQEQRLDCGAAALASVLLWKNLGPDPEVCFRALGGMRQQRASLLELKHFLADYGLVGRGFRADDSILSSVELPVLVHLDGSHFAVLAAHSTLGSVILDPGLGSFWLSREVFKRRWKGIYFSVTKL